MDKTVYAGSIVISLFLIAGSIWFPDNASMWLASSSLVMNFARGLLVALMIGLLLTNPPRLYAFRIILGAASLGFAAWSINWLLSGTIELVDALLFMQAAVSFGLAAAEAGVRIPQEQSATKPAESPSLFAQSFRTPSGSMQGLAPSSVHLAERIQRAVIVGVVITGALSQNTKPYRELWRGG